METLQISKKNAINAYKKADAIGKVLLSDLLGKENLSQKITDQVKTFEDACEILGEPPKLPYPDPSNPEEQAINATKKLFVIARALNEGWEPDWTNYSEAKYVPWFEYKSGAGFSFSVYYYWFASTHVGSRLCYKNRELAEYAGSQFKKEYNQFLSF